MSHVNAGRKPPRGFQKKPKASETKQGELLFEALDEFLFEALDEFCSKPWKSFCLKPWAATRIYLGFRR